MIQIAQYRQSFENFIRALVEISRRKKAIYDYNLFIIHINSLVKHGYK